MTRIKNPLELYKVLPKTNCRQCSAPTCLAFSAAVIKGERQLADCPHIPDSLSAPLAESITTHKTMEHRREEALEQLRSTITTPIDLASAAQKVGAAIVNEKLAVKCLGRSFFVDALGNVTSECHTHAGMAYILLDHILHSNGADVAGQWVPFGELKRGGAMSALFGQTCEKPLKRLADTYTDLFKDLIYIFSGDRSTNMFSSDVSLILYPFPKVPLLICYWEPEGDMESSLHLFFDSTVESHLSIESTYALGVGLAAMFDKVVLKHNNT